VLQVIESLLDLADLRTESVEPLGEAPSLDHLAIESLLDTGEPKSHITELVEHALNHSL